MPLLLIQNGPDAAASPTSKDPRVPKAGPAHGTELARHTRTGSPTTPDPGVTPAARLAAKRKVALLIRSTNAAARSAPAGTGGTLLSLHQAGAVVETTPPSEEVVDREALAPTATASPPTTEATAPPATAPPDTAPPPVATSAEQAYDGGGQVTYYDHPAGTCASPWLPFGTVVDVTNPANGESVSCVVNDREADTSRSLDLATATFAEIAPLSQGVIYAELSW